MTQERKRIQFKFWLDIVKNDEYALAEQAMHLKNKRGFSRTIRDGLRLILDLRAGQVDVLFELFPWVKEKVEQPTNAAPTTGLERQLERLESILKEQGGIAVSPTNQSVMKPVGAPPMIAAKTAPIADANIIADKFLAFIN